VQAAPEARDEHHPGTQNRSIEVMLPAGNGTVVSARRNIARGVNPDYTHAFQIPYGALVPANTPHVRRRRRAGVFLPDAAGSR
jgi:hypothetical protein